MKLSVLGIDKLFDGVQALKGVSLDVEKGTIHGLIGENGAGKTTLLKIMAGIYRPDAGEVRLDGDAVYERPDAKRRIAFVPTQCALFGGYREKDLIGFYRGTYAAFDLQKYRDFLGDMQWNRKTVRRLSTGMQMITSVALALATRPDILLLDEPFAGLDVIIRHRLITMLIEESESCGTAMLISSHNVNELEKLCDTATFITRGKIARTGELNRVKREAVRRLQVVFMNEEPEGLERWDGVISVERVGRVCYLSADGACADIEDRLKKAGVLMMEELGITLEDAFRISFEREGKQR